MVLQGGRFRRGKKGVGWVRAGRGPDPRTKIPVLLRGRLTYRWRSLAHDDPGASAGTLWARRPDQKRTAGKVFAPGTRQGGKKDAREGWGGARKSIPEGKESISWGRVGRGPCAKQ